MMARQAAPEGSTIDDQVALLEKSYELAAKYMGGASQAAATEKPEQKPSRNGKAVAVPVNQVAVNVVSALAQPMDDAEFMRTHAAERNYGFNTAVGNTGATEKNTIAACVHGNQTVTDGQSVRLRLLEATDVGGVRIPRNTLVVGAARVQGERLGVEIETDVIVGRTVTVDSLLGEEGYDAVFIGSGAGLPRFMGIPGENLNGVVSANEFLTRANLMHAYDKAYDTPIYVGKRVVVVGGGNVAMDAVRTAKRLGAEATIVYRRSEKELPARVEEVHHAKQEGICFRMLTNPAEVLGDERGWVTGIRCVEMELGEPDQSGRRSPVVKPGSEFDIACDVVIMALGTSPNPLLAATTAGLETDRRGCITADGQGATSREGVFAGGDAVTGAATVILAMGAGRTAARAIDEYIRKR